jgi:circadian clock protein KaiB
MKRTKSKAASSKRPPSAYELRLYITGTRPQSLRAIKNLRAFCQARLDGRYKLQIVDLYQEPEQAAQAQVIAAPTLVKMTPLPVRRMIGDMSDDKKMSHGLDLNSYE